MMKEYWFSIYPHCFVWLNENEGLLYNSKNGVKLRFNNDGLLRNVISKLLILENLYCITLTENELSEKELKLWIKDIEEKECGILVEKNEFNLRPLSLPPILKVQDDKEYYCWENHQGIDGNVIDNLHQIIFHVNGSILGNNLYSRQLLYPTLSSEYLENDTIIQFSKNARHSLSLNEIALVGNPSSIEGIDSLIDSLNEIVPVSVYSIWKDVAESYEQLLNIAEKAKLNIYITKDILKETFPLQAILHFIVTSVEEYETALEYKEKYNFRDIRIVPVYTGRNLAFFENYLYLQEKDLQAIYLNKREVFINQKINLYDFGKLIIKPNGEVYSNFNDEAIGTIKDMPQTLVFKEITKGKAWLRIRNETPCNNCIYQWLCPSPSHYEQVIGKFNLCTIKL